VGQTSVDLHPGLTTAAVRFQIENVGNTVHLIVHASVRFVPQRRRKTSRLVRVRRARLLPRLTLAAAPARKSRLLQFKPTIPSVTIVLTLKRSYPVIEFQQTCYWRMVRSQAKIITQSKQRRPAIKKLDVASSTPDFTSKSTLALLRMNSDQCPPRDTPRLSTQLWTIKPIRRRIGNMFAAAARVMPPAQHQDSDYAVEQGYPSTSDTI